MRTAKSQDEIQAIVSRWKNDGQRVAFVPTMGALHEGHLSLVRLAQKYADKVVVSIYVNPAQFAPHEDFDSYPRDVEGDAKLLKAEGVDVIYLPRREELYPNGVEITVRAGAPAEGLETDFRPHFFHGVCTVVHKLFNQIQPHIAVFGQKDFQQLMCIRDMVERLDMGIEIIGGEIARDDFGLALSSRNQYLSAPELEIARRLNVILRQGGSESEILAAGFDKVDYVSERWGRRLAAAWIGKTRLIDNAEI